MPQNLEWMTVLGLIGAPVAAAVGRFIARRRMPDGCVVWRRVDGLSPHVGAPRYETYVDLALPAGVSRRAPLVVDIRVDGLADGDVVATRRSLDPSETVTSAADFAARIVAREAGMVRVEFPDRPLAGARVAFYSATPLGDAEVEVLGGPTIPPRKRQAVNVDAGDRWFGDDGAAFESFACSALVLLFLSHPSTDESAFRRYVTPTVWTLFLLMTAAAVGYALTRKRNALDPLMRVALGR